MNSEQWLRKIDEYNRHNLRRLVDQIRAPAGIAPFVGAGLSVEFGFPQWAGFLIEQGAQARVEAEIRDLLNRGLYEEAAERVMERLQPSVFQHAMEDEFGDYRLKGVSVRGAVSLLPQLTTHQVITTNFDRVLEWVFRQAGRERDFEHVFAGARTQAVSKALSQGARVLIKLHGDVEDSEDRVLTKDEYDRHYGPADPENIASTRLTEVMRMILTRPLLFLGCSLESDRVVAMLRRLAQDLRGGLQHFAIVAAPRNDEAFLKRNVALGNMGIRPIWYPEGDFPQIERLLSRVLEAVTELSPPAAERLGRAPGRPHLSDADIASAYWEGIAALRARSYAEAAEHLRRVQSARPDYKHVQAKLEAAEAGLRRISLEAEASAAEAASAWDTAAETLETLHCLDPDDVDVKARLDRARTQVSLDALREEAREMHRRGNWHAVVASFAEMTRLDPSAPDSEGWLADARREIEADETRKLVKVHLQEGTEQIEAGEWGKALSALHRVLELQPAHQTAKELYAQAEAEVARAEAAALREERYRKARRALDAGEWAQAVELLNAVVRESPDYQDAAALLERAGGELANAAAELDLKLSVKPSPVPPNSQATWKLTVRNSGRVAVSGIAIVEKSRPADATAPGDPPFDLRPGESRTLVFTSRHTTRGVRRHLEVEGRTPNGRTVRAEAKASVNVAKPAGPAPNPVARTAAPKAPPPVPDSPRRVLPQPTRSAAAFRASLRSAKDAAALNDVRSHELLYLLEEGERHYRIAINVLKTPSGWHAQVEDWQERVAALKLDALQFVSVGPPAADAILAKMTRLAREIHRRIGILVPVQDLEALGAGSY